MTSFRSFGFSIGGAATIVAALLQTSCVLAQEVTSREAYVVMVAFECATFAQIAGNETESQRLFILGYETAQKWMKGVISGQLSPEEEKKIPMGILDSLGGPTLEFQIGRIYADTARRVSDRVWQQDLSGNALPQEEWEFDKKIRKDKASTLFNRENCIAIR
jgi:hypothetical protein